MRPLASSQPAAGRQRQPPPGTHCSLAKLCVAGPLLSGVQPQGRRQPQPPARRGLVQRPLPTLQPLLSGGAQAPLAPGGRGATLSPSVAVSPSATQALMSSTPAEQTGKLRRSSKVKTRSGRISRPPKFKAKDYKFIRTEGLLDGHPSDSDDYSELSVEEEEEEQREPRALFPPDSCALRPRAFKCQTCEKSYIGQGGLARHFKLNPGHGPPEPAKSTAGPAQECVEAAAAEGSLQNGQCVEVEENGSQSALWRSEDQGAKGNGGSETLTECGAGLLPLRHTAAAAGLRAQLEESLQRCGREDLVDVVLPRLAQVVTVYEFLLMKVEKSCLAKPLFPAIYKEFEELHHLVKKMCQDYLNSAGPCSPEPLEINNNMVAESLGITEEFLRQKEIPPDCSARKHVSQEMDVDKLTGASRQKRECEAAGEGLAMGKRPRRRGPEPLAADSRSLEEPRPLCGLSASEGFLAPVSGQVPLLLAGSRGTVVSDASGDGGVLPVSQELVAASSTDLEVRSGSTGPAPQGQHVSEPAHYAQLGEPGVLPSAPVAVIPEEKVADPGTDDGSLAAGGGGGEPPRLAEAADPSKLSGSCLHPQQACPSQVLLGDTMALLFRNVLPVDTAPVDCVSGTGPQPAPQPGPDQLLSAKGSTGSQRSHGRAAVGDTPAFTVTSRCQEGWEQVLIQTSDGQVLSHPGTSVSQEDVVIVTDTEGPPSWWARQKGLILEPWGHSHHENSLLRDEQSEPSS